MRNSRISLLLLLVFWQAAGFSQDWRGYNLSLEEKGYLINFINSKVDTFPTWEGYRFASTLLDTGYFLQPIKFSPDTFPYLRPYPPEPDLHLPPARPELNPTNAGISAGLMLISGMSHGLSKTLQWHYPRFRARHPNANPGYWNPGASWTNKYRRGDDGRPIYPLRPAYFGSTTFLAWTTDAYHLSNTISRITGVGGLTIPIWTGSRRVKDYALETGIKSVAWMLGFHSIYSGVYRK